MSVQEHNPTSASEASPVARSNHAFEPVASTADSTVRELRILQLLRRINQAMIGHSGRLRSHYNITVPQLLTLLCVIEHGPLTATAIARTIYLSNSTVVGILDRLEARGFVRRERSADDRRLVMVSATDAGRDLASRVPPPIQKGFSAALSRLPEEEQAAIERGLLQIVELMGVEDPGDWTTLPEESVDLP